MSVLEKYIFHTYNELETYLAGKGFNFGTNKFTWGDSNSNCYWTIDANGTINFHTSTNETAFYHNLTDFANDKDCGCIFLELANNGCALYLTPLDPDTDITDLQFCMINNYHESSGTIVDDSNTLENGLVVVTPAEQDGHWRYLWRDKTPQGSGCYYCIDDTVSNVTTGVEIPHKEMIVAPLTVTILKAYLDGGFWSQNIYTQVLGEVSLPGNVFKINGQKFISFTGNTTYRCPVFKLPPEAAESSPIDSTEEYSSIETYRVGDYCIYQGLLWRCTRAVTVPTQFDQTYWTVTTVKEEIERASNL